MPVFYPAYGPENTLGQMWNQETLEIFAEFIRRSQPRARTKGNSVSADAISGYVSAVRLFRSREARYSVAPPELDLNLPLALKAMRREDGPPGDRARSLGLRAETLLAAATAGADRSSAQGAVDWSAAVTAHNALLRGGELGVADGHHPDLARIICWNSISWQDPRAESEMRPWFILRVVPIKDPKGSKHAYPIPVPRRHDGPFGSDPMCPYDAVALAWWLRSAPPGLAFPLDAAGRMCGGSWHARKGGAEKWRGSISRRSGRTAGGQAHQRRPLLQRLDAVQRKLRSTCVGLGIGMKTLDAAL